MNKNPALIQTVAELRRRLGHNAFKITDHWDADLFAIGLSSPTDDLKLIYIQLKTKWDDRTERLEPIDDSFWVSLEDASTNEQTSCKEFDNVSFEKLVVIAQRHLIC
jgi:hypothetical protein